MNPSESANGDPIGDGLFALATDRPATIEELATMVARRAEEGYALYPRGGGTALDSGGLPARPGVAIDLRGLDRVIDYPVADMTVTVEAGITLSALRSILKDHGQRLWVEAPHADRATLGGIYATDTSGPRRFGQGRPRDQILGIRYVSAAGQIVKGGGRVVKNVAGYDLPKLLTGSYGTLGIIAEMTLKVRPAPEASALAWARYPNLQAASAALEALNTSATRPLAMELLNPLAASRLPGAHGHDGWSLIVGFEDNLASIDWQVDRIAAELQAGQPTILRDAEAEPLWSALVESQVSGDTILQFQASVKPSTMASFIAQVPSEHWAIQTHAGNGIIRGAWLGPAEEGTVAAEVDRLRKLVRSLGGSFVLPQCPTAWKNQLKVWGDPRPDWVLAAKVKQALDPSGLLNPGRFVATI